MSGIKNADWPNQDGIHTLRTVTDNVTFECRWCGATGVYLPSPSAARARAHRHSVKTGHITSIRVIRTVFYGRKDQV